MKKAGEIAATFVEQLDDEMILSITATNAGNTRLLAALATLIEQAREEMRLRSLEIVNAHCPEVSHDLRHAGAREACERIIAALKTPDVVYKYEKEGG